MTTIERRFDVRLISTIAFRDYMGHRGYSVRSLALRVGCSRALVGHLRSGKRTSCSPAWARAIEKALDAPAGSLFMPRLSDVTRDAAPKAKAA